MLSRHALRGIPVYTENYVIDAVRYNGNIDANHYLIQLLGPQSVELVHANTDIKQSWISSFEMKGSRDVEFSSHLPKVLYTLTWKHKYDVKIKCTQNVFQTKHEDLKKEIFMTLVFGNNYTIPQYIGNGRSGKKGVDTVVISSIQKVSDCEIVIRFGIHSTYCSKRFGYEPFRLCIHYSPLSENSETFKFTIYTSEFKTFVKKNANITKYLEDVTMDENIKLITTIFNPESLPMKPPSASGEISSGDSQSVETNTPKKRKRSYSNSKSKKKKDLEYDQEIIINTNFDFEKSENGIPSSSNLPSSVSEHSYHSVSQPVSTMSDSDIRWFGEPIGMNVNEDLFYFAFWKNGEIYKINDFVYLCPDAYNYSDIQWICKIINLVQTTSGEMKLVGQWYYKWCDIEGIIGDEKLLHDLKTDIQGSINPNDLIEHNKYISKEVFASFDMTYNPLHQIKSKCHVRWMKNIDVDWLQKKNHYFFYFGFNRGNRQLLILDDQMIRELCEATNSDTETNPVQLQQELQALQSEIKGHTKLDESVPHHIHSNHLVRRPSWEGSIANEIYIPSYSPSSLSGTTPHQQSNTMLPSFGFPSLSTPQGYPNEHQYPTTSDTTNSYMTSPSPHFKMGY